MTILLFAKITLVCLLGAMSPGPSMVVVINNAIYKNKINGIAINPEKDTAFPISIMSTNIRFVGFRKNWKKTSDTKEINITKIIFTIRSLKLEL